MIKIFALSFLLSACLAAGIIRYARAPGFLYGNDLPQRFHKGEVPRLGGLGMYASLVLVTIFYVQASSHLNIGASFRDSLLPWLLMLPAISCGVFEDLFQRVPVRVRLGSTLLVGAMLCYGMGAEIARLDLDYLDSVLALFPVAGILLAVFAIGGLPHAFNIIDGYNGLAGMVAVLISAALLHVALQLGDRQLAATLVALIGVTLGFLAWNYPHGKIFAGDGGAYLWGIAISYVCITLVSRHPEVSPWFPMLLLAYPVVETLFSIYRKKIRGQSPSIADALHLHQLIYRRMVRVVLKNENEAEEMLIRNNRTSPYLWGVTLLTVIPAVLFWRNSWLLMLCCAAFAALYVGAYLAIIRFKLPSWLQ